MIDPHHEAALVSGGDCFSHWHSTDRVVDHGTLQQLQQLVRETTVDTSPYTITPGDDMLLVDTTTGSVTANLPLAKNGRELYFVKLVAGNTMTIQPAGTDTINGAASLAITIRWTAIHLKAIAGGWIILSRYL
jgi:hypothetical protein